LAVRRYLIIGNGAAGATAAEAIRAADAQGEITLLSAEPYPMYSRPGLAYVLTSEIPELQVIARTRDWYARHRVQLIFDRAIAIDPALHSVHLASGARLHYDRLLIATGARAVPMPCPGAALPGVVYLDTLDGTRELMGKLKRARRAVVAGGGITALEMAEGFAHHGLETHYLVRRNTLWATVFNAVESDLLAERMRHHGVLIHFDSEIEQIVPDRAGRVKAVQLKSGQVLPCDLVGAAIGVKPQLDLARGGRFHVDRGLLVDEFLETSQPDIFAAGDCAQIWDLAAQQHVLDVLWPSAVAAGRAAGFNMAGGRQVYVKGTPFNVCLLFGLHITALGQLGNGREEGEVVQHLSRGSSETWAVRPHGHASAWAQDGTNTIRLTLDGDRLAGALVIGDQRLADPLRDLIGSRADIGAVRPYLLEGGPEMARQVENYWLAMRRGLPTTQRPPVQAAKVTARNGQTGG
jgi:NAD(P)H-nitrite reductase large subunit